MWGLGGSATHIVESPYITTVSTLQPWVPKHGLKIHLTLAQHGLEPYRSTYMWNPSTVYYK